MDALLERLSSGQIVAVISVIAGSIVAVIFICAVSKYHQQALTDETALKREKQQADLALRAKLIDRHDTSGASVEELLALGLGDSGKSELDAELAKRFGQLSALVGEDPCKAPRLAEIEMTLRKALMLEDARKQLVIEVVDNLLESEAPAGAILAAVRPLCLQATSREADMPRPKASV